MIVEIVTLVFCAITFLDITSPYAIAWVLASLALIGVCASEEVRVRIAGQSFFYVLCVCAEQCIWFLPVGTACALRERSWPLRLLWLCPLGVQGIVHPEVFVNPFMIAKLALLVITASVLTVSSAYELSLFRGMRYAYDDLRERYLTLQQKSSFMDENQAAPMLAPDSLFSDLTERELDIVRLIAEGKDNKEIAAELFLSQGTVRNHISNILMKKALSNRTQLAVLFVKHECG